MNTEMNAINAKIESVLSHLNSGDYKNYDMIREFQRLKRYVEQSDHGIEFEDAQEMLHYATEVMEDVQAEYHNTKHPRFIQAYALRLMASAVIEAYLDPYDDSDWGYAQRAENSLKYANEAHNLIVGLYVK